jgi:hypothetical protein
VHSGARGAGAATRRVRTWLLQFGPKQQVRSSDYNAGPVPNATRTRVSGLRHSHRAQVTDVNFRKCSVKSFTQPKTLNNDHAAVAMLLSLNFKMWQLGCRLLRKCDSNDAMIGAPHIFSTPPKCLAFPVEIVSLKRILRRTGVGIPPPLPQRTRTRRPRKSRQWFHGRQHAASAS